MSSGSPAPERPQPDSSVPGMALTTTVGNAWAMAAATACPATAAVPWPTTRTRWTRPDGEGLAQSGRYDVVAQADDEPVVFARDQFAPEGLAHR